MTPKKYLSNKKISQQAISISPALKDWIKRYVNVMAKKNPHDERYKSISSFYCHVMERVLTIFEKNKTLDDLDKFVDSEIAEFYKDDFILFAPYVEASVVLDAFTTYESILNSEIFFKMHKIFFKSVDLHDLNNVRLFFERFRNRYLRSNIPKEIRVEIITAKDKKGFEGVIEHICDYEYSQILNVKITALIIGILGFKITDCYYSKEFNHHYFRIKIVTTDLFFDTGEVRNERLALARENIYHIINFNRIIEYKSPHLWQKLAEDNDVIINFNSKQARNRWIKRLEEDFKKFGTKDSFLLKFLKAFERLHWIRIENENFLQFQIRLNKDKYSDEIQFLKEYLSKYSKILQTNDIYYLEREK
jgi:hypothetical protein